jgi:hypothetical protein
MDNLIPFPGTSKIETDAGTPYSTYDFSLQEGKGFEASGLLVVTPNMVLLVANDFTVLVMVPVIEIVSVRRVEKPMQFEGVEDLGGSVFNPSPSAMPRPKT